MLWIQIKRVVKSGFTNFWRNSVVSLSSLLIMIVTLLVISGVIFTTGILQTSLEEVSNRVDVNVYFVPHALEEEVLQAKAEIEQLSEVQSVEYISRDQALEDFRNRNSSEQVIIEALNELEQNPLGAVLNVRAHDPEQYEMIANRLTETYDPGSSSSVIDRVNYLDNKEIIDRFIQVINGVKTFSGFLTVFFIIVSCIITFNTIRLAIYISRDEIQVMRLVGASNSYIRGPFVVTGAIYGLTAALLSLIILWPLTYWLSDSVGRFAGVNLFDYYLANFGQIFLILILAGIGIGTLASYIAVRRHLKI